MFTGVQPTQKDPLGICKFALNVLQTLVIVHNAIINSRVNQMVQANKHCQNNNESFTGGQLVFILTENLSLPKGQA